MQIDSHMTFAKHWDAISVEMLLNAPSKKPVISHYPPSETENLDPVIPRAAPRLCHVRQIYNLKCNVTFIICLIDSLFLFHNSLCLQIVRLKVK